MQRKKKDFAGIIRPIDKLGRISIPKEILRKMCLRQGDALAVIDNHDGELLLKRSATHCALCGVSENIRPIAGGCICISCAKRFCKIT